MDLWQLKVFEAVVDEGGFSKAANKLHLSQPTVSAHIKDLEDYFSCRLLDRLGKKVLPTKGGELLYSFTRRILDLKDEMESALLSFQGEPQGSLLVGGSTIPGSYVLPGLIGGFLKDYPKARISLEIGSTREIAMKVAEGGLDMGVVGALSKDARLMHEKIFDDEIRLVAPFENPWFKDKNVRLNELGKAPFVIREKGSGTRQVLENFLVSQGLGLHDLSVVAELGSTEAVREAVKAGIGLSILSLMAVGDDIKAGSLSMLFLENWNARRPFFLITRKGKTPSPICGFFIKFIKQQYLSEEEK